MSRARQFRHRRSVLVALLLPLSALLSPVLADDGRVELDDADAGDLCRTGKLELAGSHASPAYDDVTGRDLRNYPPDRLVDYVHMKLEMRFEDLSDMRFTATETLIVAPIGSPTSSLTLDAVGLDIGAVRMESGSVEHFQDDETVTLRFDPPLEVGTEYAIIFDYVCDHPYDGMFFTPYSGEAPHYTAEVHTQGQTITNRHWFIAHDSPDERMTTELIVNVPAGRSVSSNGRLVSSFTNDDRAVWHWLQDKPHVSYLVTLVIGDFDIVDLPHERVPMKVWVPQGLGDHVLQTYGRTGGMIDLFERRFGVPYPWDRYDQLLVKNFGSGGMENTSATTMYPTAVLDETALLDGDLDGLIAHELAHQWAGDLLTCKEWAHVWLNEGFATFGAALWFEERRGEDGYLDSVMSSFRRVTRRDDTTNAVGMVSPVYDGPWETFGRAANPYPKGASILHMLRRMLGEDVFWTGMHLYMNRHREGTVETSDFRYALEEVSGRGLEWFFDQWCYRPGCPELDVAVSYDGQSRQLGVEVEQTQHIDERTPAFRFTLPVHVLTGGGWEVCTVEVEETSTSFQTVIDGVPRVVAVDPGLHVLCTMEIDKPQTMWIAQLEEGPTLPARRRAIGALAELDTPDHRARLADLIRDDAWHESLRNAAVAALSGYGSDEARSLLLALLDEGVAEAKVRVRLVEALGSFEADEVSDRLGTIASSDPSYATRVAAIEAIGDLEIDAHADLVAELVHFPSQHDRVRNAALTALADLDDPRGLDLAIQYAAYGHVDRSRPRAIGVIGTLADHDRDRAVAFLIDRLNDPERRTVRAAGETLAKLGDERAIAPLEAMANTHPSPRTRERAERWVKRIREGGTEARGQEGERSRHQ